MGAFWNCLMGTEVDVGIVRERRSDPAAGGERLLHPAEDLLRAPDHRVHPQARGGARIDVGPGDRLLRARSGRRSRSTSAALPKMQEGLETYAEKLKSRGATKDVDQSIQEVGAAFSPEPSRRVGGVREVPGLRHPGPRQEEGHPGGAGVPGRHLQEGSGRVHDQGARRLRRRWSRRSTRTRSRRRRRPSRRTPRSSTRRISASCRPGSTAAASRARARSSSTSSSS